MKQTIISLVIMVTVATATAQDTKENSIHRKFGIGLQSSFPVYGLSLKIAISNKSMIQPTFAPFSASAGGSTESINFYGARYVLRFPGEDGLDPYLFVGGGLISFTSGTGSLKTSDNFFGYSAGGGLELIIANRLALSAELGYGKLGVTSGLAVSAITYGGGIHFYIN